jgi:hypothetical protein
MTTAIDTNVIASLWNEDEALNRTASGALKEAKRRGQMVICGPVYAELLAAPGRTAEFIDTFCAEARIDVEWRMEKEIWRAAGTAYQSYAARRKKHKAGEPRRILADFLIGAHALMNGYRLLTLDERVYRKSFPRLMIETV